MIGGPTTITVDSPLGPIRLVATDEILTHVLFDGEPDIPIPDRAPEPTEPDAFLPGAFLKDAAAQMVAYFDKRLNLFDLALAPAATPFQGRVRAAMQAIPYGETLSYGAVAKSLNGSPRAVGQACGRNPIPIVVPCHRILAAQGRIGGFSGGDGVPTKQLLLAHEAPDLFNYK
jgi:methylated-DNA-[protein]-cysteine S-methyltransferase